MMSKIIFNPKVFLQLIKMFLISVADELDILVGL